MLLALPNAFGDAATNMAIDVALLQSLPHTFAVFRHYGWLEPSTTFGYAQRYDEVRQAAGATPMLCRRPTGGGIVDHRNDWTYALVLHHALPAAATPATQLYEHIHRAMARTLTDLDIKTHLAPCPKDCAAAQRPTRPDQCFAKPAANDVLRADGRKIAGAAMKRNRHGLLIQGSLDRAALPDVFDFSTFQARLVNTFAKELDLSTGKIEDIRPLFDSARIEAEKQRFASSAWNQRR
jgi:lipoate-protein ligase A